MSFLQGRPWPTTKKLATALISLSADFLLTSDGILVRYAKTDEHMLVCIPISLTAFAMEIVHEPPTAGHQGIKATVKRAQQFFWWPRLTANCTQYVKLCAPCAQFKAQNRRPIAPLGMTDAPYEIWENLFMDHWAVGLGDESRYRAKKNPKKGVLAFVDGFSKYVILVAVETFTVAEVVEAFMRHVAAIYGLPVSLRSDGGPGFIAALQTSVFNAVGVVRKFCVAYRPQANGQVERLFRTFKPLVATLAKKYPSAWPIMLPHAAFAYNTTYRRAIDNTPYYLMFGRDPEFQFDLAKIAEHRERPKEICEKVFKRLQFTRSAVRIQLDRHRQEMKAYYDRIVAKYFKNRKFTVGQLIWLSLPRPIGPLPALSPKFVGPYRIHTVQHQTLGVVPLAQPHDAVKLIHSDRAKHCLEHTRLGNEAREFLLERFAIWGIHEDLGMYA